MSNFCFLSTLRFVTYFLAMRFAPSALRGFGTANSFMHDTQRYILQHYLTENVRKLAALKLLDKWRCMLYFYYNVV